MFCFLERIFLLSIGELDFFGGIHYRIITTAISEVSSAKKAKTIRYYNTLGTESSHPFKGINIMVTTHTDGTSNAVKVLHRH